MSDKRCEGLDKMSVEFVNEAKGMADFILVPFPAARITAAGAMLRSEIVAGRDDELADVVRNGHAKLLTANSPANSHRRRTMWCQMNGTAPVGKTHESQTPPSY